MTVKGLEFKYSRRERRHTIKNVAADPDEHDEQEESQKNDVRSAND